MMSQPNDLAIARTTRFARAIRTGRRAQAGSGVSAAILNHVGRRTRHANGIEVSPDGKTLYVNESAQRNVWAFDIEKDGSLSNKKLAKKFPDAGFDGMRCDVEGNLYIARYGKGTVVKMSPKGEILQEVDVLGMSPSNLCFGGPDGKTVYVTEVTKQRLVSFRTDSPGLAWKRWQK